MRNSRSWIIWAVLCAACLLLLGSALLETPESAPETSADVTAKLHVTLLPYTVPAPEQQADSLQSRAPERARDALPAQDAPKLISAAAPCDANGRVIRCKRYVRSFYQSYHQETACG